MKTILGAFLIGLAIYRVDFKEFLIWSAVCIGAYLVANLISALFTR